MNSKSVDTPMDHNAKLVPNQGQPFLNPKKYIRLVENFNFLIVARSHISIAISVLSQFLNSSCVDHQNAFTLVLKYIKDSPEGYMVTITILKFMLFKC